MKNKESKSSMRPMSSSRKGGNSKIDSEEAKRIITGGRNTTASKRNSSAKGPTKTQIDRMKKFYNTTKWLPNSAFTTYFGKPAFENYGYGNTKPVYGGLFYGNYMLSHNINPMDGGNRPETKQVYSSAMLKTIQRNNIRRPEPPRKTPDEIRNTPEELEEIRGRNPIFQLQNQFPERDIVRPNLLKSRYFRSGKNTPNQSFDENDLDGEYEVFEIEDVLNNRTSKKKKRNILSSKISSDFNPYAQGKVQLPKKKTKEDSQIYEEHLTEEKGDDDYLIKKQYFEKMLKDETYDNASLKTNEDSREKLNQRYVVNKQPSMKRQSSKAVEVKRDLEEKEVQTGDNFYPQEDRQDDCSMCHSVSRNDTKTKLKKKENPCLFPPQNLKQTYVCCNHLPDSSLSLQDADPRNYMNQPPCMLNKIIPAGRPLRKSEPVSNLFN